MEHVPGTRLDESEAAAEARLLIEAVEDAYRAKTLTAYRDPTPVPAIGTAPPVPQPGRLPMSQRATDLSGLLLAGSVATISLGGSVSLVLWTAGQAGPVVVSIVIGGPTALLLALGRVFRRAKEARTAAPPKHHHHYNAPVLQDHRSITSRTHGLIARSRNELPG
ncbi:hypothetical protein ACH4FX_37580 [Streptomyces sp. NPDC018019]|uniref:hypothetical protein n=1 Tax=Streptomyces sp. NPDC018019 TaxID=3365030 RepID=UPI0037943851